MSLQNKLFCILILIFSGSLSIADSAPDIKKPDWIDAAGNFDLSYHQTNYLPSHNVGIGNWDSRIQFWLPFINKPNKKVWSLYLRFAGVSSTSTFPSENGYLSAPGFGIQIYPFTLADNCKDNETCLKGILGPLRLFAEYNRMNYWGTENSWRPNNQGRLGADYWNNLHANNLESTWWAEIWQGLYWASANEFTPNYNTLNYGTSIRAGVRKASESHNDISPLSYLTPYAVLQNAVNTNNYYWENKLTVGGGLRITPDLKQIQSLPFLNRLVIYAEYDYIANYWVKPAASLQAPNYDVVVGINFSFGNWFNNPNPK